MAKLPKARVDALVRGAKGKHFDPGHGRLMKEWVALAGADGSCAQAAMGRRARGRRASSAARSFGERGL